MISLKDSRYIHLHLGVTFDFHTRSVNRLRLKVVISYIKHPRFSSISFRKSVYYFRDKTVYYHIEPDELEIEAACTEYVFNI